MNRNVITARRVGRLVDWMVGEGLHAKRVDSLTNAVGGVVNAASLSIHAIGAGLAKMNGLHTKHAIQQVDRLLSNVGLNVWALFAQLGPVRHRRTHRRRGRRWTGPTSTPTASRPSPCPWSPRMGGRCRWCGLIVEKAQLKDRRNEYEDVVLLRLREVLPPGVQVTILADRGFGDQKLYERSPTWGLPSSSDSAGVVVVESRDGERRRRTTGCRPTARSDT